MVGTFFAGSSFDLFRRNHDTWQYRTYHDKKASSLAPSTKHQTSSTKHQTSSTKHQARANSEINLAKLHQAILCAAISQMFRS